MSHPLKRGDVFSGHGLAAGMDMTSGPIFLKLLVFSLPLAASGMLQRLFNTADIIIVGQYAGAASLAAVGATGTIVNLLVDTFLGFSIGANILTAHCLGTKDFKKVSVSVHSAFILGMLLGTVLLLLGILVSGPLLTLTNVPQELFANSLLYLRLYFCGAPFMLTYNFCAAVLRANGDTVRPLTFLLTSGVANVLLNLLFVVVLQMDVAGVAIATVISQILSFVLVVICLLNNRGPCRLWLRGQKFDSAVAREIFKIGLPAGIQSAAFTFSNVVMQSSVNGFGTSVIAAHSTSASIYMFTHTCMNAVSQATITFCSQNCGAKCYNRLTRILYNSLTLVCSVGVLVGFLTWFLRKPLLGLFIPATDPNYSAIIAAGSAIMTLIDLPYFVFGVMEVFSGMVRGLGHSTLPTVISILGICVFRILWIRVVFPTWPTLTVLFSSALISWLITGIAHYVCYRIFYKRLFVQEMGLSQN